MRNVHFRLPYVSQKRRVLKLPSCSRSVVARAEHLGLWHHPSFINLVPRVSFLCLHCRWEKTLVHSGHVSLRNLLGDGWQCRPCRYCKEGNQHAIGFVARWPSTKRLTAVFFMYHTYGIWRERQKVVVKSMGRHRKYPRVIQVFTRVKVRINEEC